MLPVFEGNNALLFYPVQYEGLESSKNIFYTGATTNQQIIPALDYLKEKGVKTLFLVGSDYVFPRTANKIIKAYAAANGIEINGEEYVPLGNDRLHHHRQRRSQSADADSVFNTLNGDSNVAFFKEYKNAGLTADAMPVSRCRSPRRRSAASASTTSSASRWPGTTTRPSTPRRTRSSSQAFKTEYGADKVTSDPMEAAYTSLYLWKDMVEKAKSFAVAGRPGRRGRRDASPHRRARSRSTARTTTSPRPRSSARSRRTA